MIGKKAIEPEILLISSSPLLATSALGAAHAKFQQGPISTDKK